MTEVLMWHSKKPRRSQLRGFSIPFWVGTAHPSLPLGRGDNGSRDWSLVHCRGQSRLGEALGAERPLPRATPCCSCSNSSRQGKFTISQKWYNLLHHFDNGV